MKLCGGRAELCGGRVELCGGRGELCGEMEFCGGRKIGMCFHMSQHESFHWKEGKEMWTFPE